MISRLRSVVRPIAVRALHSSEPLLKWAQFNVDTIGRPHYHPLPECKHSRATRIQGCLTRWKLIEPLVDSHRPQTAIDIGSNTGWFSTQVAARGIPTIALEGDPRFLRILEITAPAHAKENIIPMNMNLSPNTMPLLPKADFVMFLAVWHHMVRDFGLNEATEMMKSIWARTNQVMVFETGETEVPDSFGLPNFGPDASAWLLAYLEDSCANGHVLRLGTVEAPLEYEGHTRGLYAIIRQ